MEPLRTLLEVLLHMLEREFEGADGERYDRAYDQMQEDIERVKKMLEGLRDRRKTKRHFIGRGD